MNARAPSPPAMLDLLLREKETTDRLCADRDQAAALLPRLLAIGAASIAAWALVHGGLLLASQQSILPAALADAPPWWTPIVLFCALEGGLMGAQLAGMPSFYFYGLLAGIETHGWRIVAESMRARATAAVVLLGLLPVYLAVGLGLVLVFPDAAWDARALHSIVLGFGGTALPFVAGLAAPGSLYRAFRRMLAEGMPPGQTRRRPMPLLLVLAWSALFTALAPLGAWRIGMALLDPAFIPSWPF
jgi:hypothetical protein